MVYDPNNPELLRQFQQGFIKGVETDPRYPHVSDVAGQEDEMLYRIGEAVELGFMSGEQGENLYFSWIQQRRPDTVIVRQVRTDEERWRFYE